MQTIIVLKQMIVLFVLMVVGYGCYKLTWVDQNSYAKLSKIVVNVFNPMLIINGVLGQAAGNDMKKILLNLALVGIYFALLVILSFPLVKLLGLKAPTESLYRMMLIFSNVGFMGIPVISSVYGEGIVLYIAFYILGYNFLLYTYGIHLAAISVHNEETEEKQKDSFRKLILNPGVIACVIAIIIFAVNIPVPGPAAALVSYLGEPAVPMSMILIGASMAQQDWKKLFKDTKIYFFLAIRLLLIPIVAALIIGQLSLDVQIAGLFILMLAMPVGSIVVLLATDRGADETCCIRGSVLSTLFSVITIPIIALFLP